MGSKTARVVQFTCVVSLLSASGIVMGGLTTSWQRAQRLIEGTRILENERREQQAAQQNGQLVIPVIRPNGSHPLQVAPSPTPSAPFRLYGAQHLVLVATSSLRVTTVLPDRTTVTPDQQWNVTVRRVDGRKVIPLQVVPQLLVRYRDGVEDTATLVQHTISQDGREMYFTFTTPPPEMQTFARGADVMFLIAGVRPTMVRGALPPARSPFGVTFNSPS
ncbi:MAG TPA: hypothetical protein VK157_11720 [Phycisphaerales bacterium]|nr:hypothetical protein [Phycisphaerales bacterium]